MVVKLVFMESNNVGTFQFNPLLDQKCLEELYENDLEYVIQMFEIYIEMVESEILKLKNAAESSNNEEVRQIAHKIKPVFLMVGLPKLNALAKQIESKYNSVADDELIRLISVLYEKINETTPILVSEIDAMKSVKSPTND